MPLEETYLRLSQVPDVAEAIRTLTVRGAPAIGIAAAYAMVLAAREDGDFMSAMERAAELLKATRPTAVNLAHGVDTLLAEARAVRARTRAERIAALAERARAYHRADVEACRTMGRLGQALLPEEGAVLTHCNAGALATGGYGTALGVIRAAREANKRITVIADETRPLLQGARLTALELQRAGVPVTLICDSMAAQCWQSPQR